jgi:hypothetical protein
MPTSRQSAGRLSHWTATPVGRLLLILLAGPIARTLFTGRPEAFAGETLALRLVEEGLRSGQAEALAKPWEKLFLLMPWPRPKVRATRYGWSGRRRWPSAWWRKCPGGNSRSAGSPLGQIRAYQDQIARFGRFPHGCNVHFCVYAAFGAATNVRAGLTMHEKAFDKKRGYIVGGPVHIVLAVLTL